jgi:hypothetical protein
MCILVKRKTKKNEFEIIHAQKKKRIQKWLFFNKTSDRQEDQSKSICIQMTMEREKRKEKCRDKKDQE